MTQKTTMEKDFQPTWMQSVTCLHANECLARNLKKVIGEKQYLYFPACQSPELDCNSSAPTQSDSGSSKSTPGTEGLHMWEPVSGVSADFPPTKKDPSPSAEASHNLENDPEASSCTEVTESSWVLRTLQRVTFTSSYLDPYVDQGCDTAGRRYLYAPPSLRSGFVHEGFPSGTQIHLDKKEAKSLLAEEDEPLVEITQNH